MADLYHPDKKLIDIADVLAALSDPVRLQMVAEMHANGPAASTAFAPGLPKSTRSHHLKVLREAGVTYTEVAGVERYVSLRYDCLGERFPGLLDSVLNATSQKKNRKK